MARRGKKRYLFDSEKARQCQLISTQARQKRKEMYLQQLDGDQGENDVPSAPRYNLRRRSNTAQADDEGKAENDEVQLHDNILIHPSPVFQPVSGGKVAPVVYQHECRVDNLPKIRKPRVVAAKKETKQQSIVAPIDTNCNNYTPTNNLATYQTASVPLLSNLQLLPPPQTIVQNLMLANPNETPAPLINGDHDSVYTPLYQQLPPPQQFRPQHPQPYPSSSIFITGLTSPSPHLSSHYLPQQTTKPSAFDMKRRVESLARIATEDLFQTNTPTFPLPYIPQPLFEEIQQTSPQRSIQSPSSPCSRSLSQLGTGPNSPMSSAMASLSHSLSHHSLSPRSESVTLHPHQDACLVTELSLCPQPPEQVPVDFLSPLPIFSNTTQLPHFPCDSNLLETPIPGALPQQQRNIPFYE